MGEDIQRTATSMQGEIRPRWTGWEVRSASARVRWSGGIRGVATKVKGQNGKLRLPELLSADALAAAMKGSEESGL